MLSVSAQWCWSSWVAEGGAALAQLWLFIVAPLLGGAIAAGVWKCLGKEN